MVDVVKCPFCGLEADESSFRVLREPWRFGFYTKRMYECPRCREVFNYYEGISPRNKHLAFTIKIRPRIRGNYEHSLIAPYRVSITRGRAP